MKPALSVAEIWALRSRPAAAKKVTGEKIILSCKTAEHAKEKAEKLGAAYGQAEEAARDARFVFIGVKPGNLYEVSEKVSPVLKERTDEFIVVSMLAGVGLKTLGDVFGRKAKIIRIMPNTPALVGEGLTLFCTSAAVTQEEKKEFSELLGFSGVIDEISENLIDAASGRVRLRTGIFVYVCRRAVRRSCLLRA